MNKTEKLAELMEIASGIFRTSSHYFKTEPQVAWPDYLTRDLLLKLALGESTDLAVVIAYREGKPAGALLGYQHSLLETKEDKEQGKTGMSIWQMVTHKDHLRKGVAAEMVRNLSVALPEKFSHIFLGIVNNNPTMLAACEGGAWGMQFVRDEPATKQFTQGGKWYRAEIHQGLSESPWSTVTFHLSKDDP